MSRTRIAVVPTLLILWISRDMVVASPSSLTHFDGHEVGRLETAMWRSYYKHQRVQLFTQLVDLMRRQYHFAVLARLPGGVACRSRRRGVPTRS